MTITTEIGWQCIITFKAVEQQVILYGSEILVLTVAIQKVVEGFQHWECRHITGITPTGGAGREW